MNAAASKGSKILVVDDDPVMLELAIQTLEGAGYAVFVSPSGEQAIEIATTQEMDLALLDYRMPDMTGLDVGKAITDLTSTRFIIMSVHADEDVVRQAGGEGALGFLVKPLEPKELLAQVHVGLTRAAEINALQSSIEDMQQGYAAALSKAVASARTVNTAIGILMERLFMTREQATQLITREAKNQRKRMVELAEGLIAAREQDYRARNDDCWWLASTRRNDS
ncbi:MAG: response regulator [Gammaproteobacteria bacterium]|nr:response regulator [Gammaproteobacteria bacterium]